MEKNKEFSPFYTPLEDEPMFTNILIKGDQKDPSVLYIEASDEGVDQSNEIMFMKALEEEAESFLKNGVLSWDHLHKAEGDPKYIVGEPLDVRFDRKPKKTFVKGKLYKKQDFAKTIMDLLASGCTKLGASVGGFIKQKKSLSKAVAGILKVIWDELAITYKPVNNNTRGNISLIPIGAFAKALMIGQGVNAENFTGGRALSRESMQGTPVNLIEEMTWRIKKGDILTSDDLKDFLSYKNALFLYGRLANLLIKKFS